MSDGGWGRPGPWDGSYPWPGAPVPGPPAAGPPASPAPRRTRGWLVVLVVALVAVVLGVGAVIGLALAPDGPKEGDRAELCALLVGPVSPDTSYIVFLQADVTAAEVEEVGDQLRALPGLSDLVFVDQEEAYQEALALFEDQPITREQLRAEDIPPSFRFVLGGRDRSAELSELASVVNVANSASPAVRVVDLLGALAEGRVLLSRHMRRTDAEVAVVLRRAVPGELDEAADRVAGWIEELPAVTAPAEPWDEPSVEVQRAADDLLDLAADRCGVHPREF